MILEKGGIVCEKEKCLCEPNDLWTWGGLILWRRR